MAKKPTISNISSGYASTTTLNNNFTALRDGFDNTLSLDGSTPNSMNADFDVNGYRILNAGQIDTDALYLNGVAITSSADVDFQTTYLTASYTGDGSTVAYSLTANPQSEGNVSIYVDGVYQNKDTFSLSGTTVTFSEAPPLNAAIEIVYPTNTDTLNGSLSSAITYNQGGTGAQDRTLLSRLKDYVSVIDFGADTGASAGANTTAFANAIAASNTVFIPAGTYSINYIDLSDVDDLRLYGEAQKTILNFGTGTANLDGDDCAIMINDGTGGSGGTHTTSSRRLRLDGFFMDCNGLDIGIYADFMTDSHLENIAVRDVGTGVKVNYSWMNMFTNFDVQTFTAVGFDFTGSNLNGNTLVNHRVSASTNGSRCYYVSGNSTKLISCDAEGSVSDFTGMDISAGRAISIDSCHFEGGRCILYSTSDRVESLSITGCYFAGDTYAINGSDYAESLTIMNNVFAGSNDDVTIDTINGMYAANKFEGSSSYSVGSNFKGMLHDGTRFMSEKRLERQYIRIPTFSTSSGSPSTLATFPEYSARTSGKVVLEQRLGANNTSSVEINFAISEDTTLRQGEVLALGTALGITLSIVDDGDTRTLKAYGTYSSNLAGYVDLVTY